MYAVQIMAILAKLLKMLSELKAGFSVTVLALVRLTDKSDRFNYNIFDQRFHLASKQIRLEIALTYIESHNSRNS